MVEPGILFFYSWVRKGLSGHVAASLVLSDGSYVIYS